MSTADQLPAWAHLNVPGAPPANYSRNFIKQAVCELRFPTLYELEGARPPVSFAQALRKEYPIQDLMETVSIGGGGAPSRANVHAFRSKRQRWTVTLGASSVKLETAHYGAFDEFKERLALVVKAATPIIDSDFFTRVGLRYINVLPYTRTEVDKWINPSLVGALAAGIYGEVNEHNGRVIGSTPFGGYLLQHGIVIDGKSIPTEYSLDFDLFSEYVQLNEALDTVQKLHDAEFSLFQWAIGPAAKSFLGPSNHVGSK